MSAPTRKSSSRAPRRTSEVRAAAGSSEAFHQSTGGHIQALKRRRSRTRRWMLAAVMLAAAGAGAGIVFWLPPPASRVETAKPAAAPVSVVALVKEQLPANTAKESRQRQKLAGAAPKAVAPAPEFGSSPTTDLLVRAVDPFELARSIAEGKRGAVQLCYERELKRNPRIRGKVTVQLDLRPPNRVKRVTVRDTLRRPTFTRCVRTAMQRTALPPLKEELALEIPFSLRSPEL